MADELFSKRLPVTLKSQDREDRKAHIQIAIEQHTTANPVHKKELVVRLTDEEDLFFLYTLRLSEEDFQSLKVQQGLLVDFGAFPQKFVDLLVLCMQEEHKDQPKFIVHLVSNGSSASSTANLNVIETNPFKHLTHLSLKFLPGTDTDIKKYLAGCLKTLKDQNQTLLQRLEHTEGDLSQQLRQAREALSTRTVELDGLRTEWNTKISDLSSRHAQEHNTEKEKVLRTQSDSQQRYEREKRELEQAHMKIVKQLEAKAYEMETANKDLLDRKYKSEASIRELKSKLSLLEEEHHRAKTELQALRKDNAGLDSGYHDQEKVLNQLKMRLAVAEQEIKDKEEVMKKTSELLNTEQEQKRKGEDEVDRKKRHIGKLEGSIKTMSQELIKGNEIIKKLQGEIKNYHSKLKLRSQVTTEQEKLLGAKNKDVEEVKQQLEGTRQSLRLKEDENKKLGDSLEVTLQKLEESKQLLKTNENVINWLNKQVTQVQLSQGSHGPFEMTSGSAQTGFKASSALHNFSAPSMSSGMPSRLTTPGQSPLGSVPVRPPAQPQIHYQPGQPRKTCVPVPIAKSSPIGSIPEERERLPEGAAQASPAHLVNANPRTIKSDPFLDAKYLQQGPQAPLRSASVPVTSSSPSIHFPLHSQTPPPGASHLNPTRISREAIGAPRPGAAGVRPPATSHQAPTLASAYFPGQKVS